MWEKSVRKLLRKTVDESGIRTHASEETGALNQRLRPLGHLAIQFSLPERSKKNGTWQTTEKSEVSNVDVRRRKTISK